MPDRRNNAARVTPVKGHGRAQIRRGDVIAHVYPSISAHHYGMPVIELHLFKNGRLAVIETFTWDHPDPRLTEILDLIDWWIDPEQKEKP